MPQVPATYPPDARQAFFGMQIPARLSDAVVQVSFRDSGVIHGVVRIELNTSGRHRHQSKVYILAYCSGIAHSGCHVSSGLLTIVRRVDAVGQVKLIVRRCQRGIRRTGDEILLVAQQCRRRLPSTGLADYQSITGSVI